MKFRKIPFNSPVNVFFKILENCNHAFLLESIGEQMDSAGFSFIGFDPKTIVNIKNSMARVGDERLKVEDPLSVMKEILKPNNHLQSSYRFIGGAVGYISYDVIRYWEKIPNTSLDNLNFPDIEMGIYDDGLIFDHLRNEAFYFYRDENRYDEAIKYCQKSSASVPKISFSTPKPNIDRENYDKLIERAKEYIFSGDIFQVVLSKRYTFSVDGGLEAFYLNLRAINPSPYMYFLKMDDRFIVGSSPETLVKVENGVIEVCPIAGTRPVTGDPEKDLVLESELLNDPKEIAEHIMLVDLARNDVGKVSKFGSVSVSEFMKIYKYSHVQHIVSKVTGKLRDEYDCFDVFRAVFPAGTVSGAPKVRAMEIIEELERFRRGPYAGAVGYFSYNGNMDFAITIRTLFAKDNKFHVQVGSGIVADSTPEREWFETEFKAKALFKALELAGGD